jgi:hypothetical protein
VLPAAWSLETVRQVRNELTHRAFNRQTREVKRHPCHRELRSDVRAGGILITVRMQG